MASVTVEDTVGGGPSEFMRVVLECDTYQFAARSRTSLVEQPLHRGLYSMLRYLKCAREFFISGPPDQQAQRVAFTVRQIGPRR